MSVYKLTCSETGKIYYGSTGNPINVRQNKGWSNCACKDFVNPEIEEIEHIEDKHDRLMKENEYIMNNECVNKNRAVAPTNEQRNKELWLKRKDCPVSIQEDKDYRKKIIAEKRFYCKLCDIAFQAPKKLLRHTEGFRHKLKQQSYDKYGEDWVEHYLEDNRLRYNKTRRK